MEGNEVGRHVGDKFQDVLCSSIRNLQVKRSSRCFQAEEWCEFCQRKLILTILWVMCRNKQTRAPEQSDARGKEPSCQGRRCKRRRFDPWVGTIPWRRAWQPTPVFLPGDSHGQRSLAGCGSEGHKESDTTEATEYTHKHLNKNMSAQ